MIQKRGGGVADVKYPGISTTTDGAGNVVWVESHITDGSCAYPITSSTTMGVGYNLEVVQLLQIIQPCFLLYHKAQHERLFLWLC